MANKIVPITQYLVEMQENKTLYSYVYSPSDFNPLNNQYIVKNNDGSYSYIPDYTSITINDAIVMTANHPFDFVDSNGNTLKIRVDVGFEYDIGSTDGAPSVYVIIPYGEVYNVMFFTLDNTLDNWIITALIDNIGKITTIAPTQGYNKGMFSFEYYPGRYTRSGIANYTYDGGGYAAVYYYNTLLGKTYLTSDFASIINPGVMRYVTGVSYVWRVAPSGGAVTPFKMWYQKVTVSYP